MLTDSDIERYTKTLANPKLTKEQADNAVKQLLETIDFSIGTQLDTLDKTGKDVREFDGLREETAPALKTSRVKKGDMSDKDFVEKALTAQGVSYSDVVKLIPAGKKGVILNSSGEIGAIPEKEFDPAVYTAL